MTSARFYVIFTFHDFKTMSATKIHFFILVLYTSLYFILVLVRKDKIVKYSNMNRTC